MSEETKKPDEILAEASEMFRNKSLEYGNNYLKIGEVLKSLFPDGLVLTSVEDHNRYHLFLLQLVKITRYSENFIKGGHPDSLSDLIVYTAMLKSVDENMAVFDDGSEIPF